MKPGWTSIVEMIELHKIIGKDFCNNQSAISLLLVWSIKTCIILLQEQNFQIFSFASWNILSWHQMKYFFISPMHNMWSDIRKFSKLYLAHLNLFHFLSSDEIFICQVKNMVQISLHFGKGYSDLNQSVLHQFSSVTVLWPELPIIWFMLLTVLRTENRQTAQHIT